MTRFRLALISFALSIAHQCLMFAWRHSKNTLYRDIALLLIPLEVEARKAETRSK